MEKQFYKILQRVLNSKLKKLIAGAVETNERNCAKVAGQIEGEILLLGRIINNDSTLKEEDFKKIEYIIEKEDDVSNYKFVKFVLEKMLNFIDEYYFGVDKEDTDQGISTEEIVIANVLPEILKKSIDTIKYGKVYEIKQQIKIIVNYMNYTITGKKELNENYLFLEDFDSIKVVVGLINKNIDKGDFDCIKLLIVIFSEVYDAICYVTKPKTEPERKILW